MKHELLSPAGNIECLYAAINAGADAVYAGTDNFSARAFAGNINREDFIHALRVAHMHGVKVYLALNTLIKSSEFEDAYKTVRPLYESGLDGIIVQDLGLADMLKICFPDLELHASTQMSIMNSYGAKLMKEHGFSRIVPARELTIEEVKNIKDSSGLEVECFIHGAMCYSYSGLCLMSSMIGQRSGNRGKCAGTCRLPFNVKGIINSTDNKYKDQYTNQEEYPLSMKDMCTLDILPMLIDAGIDSFKIEGRMKSPEYVAGVTSLYRKYIDKYLSDKNASYKVSKEDREHLLSLYIRTGISRGYYEGYKGKELITLDSPGYNGNDPVYEDQIHEKYVHECEKIPVNMYAYFHEGQNAVLTAGYEDIYVSEEGNIVSEAKKAPLEEKVLGEKLTKTGQTCVSVNDLTIDLGKNTFMSVGEINSLRRDVLSRLEDEIIASKGFFSKRDDIAELKAYFELILKKDKFLNKSPYDERKFEVLVSSKPQLEAFLDIYEKEYENGPGNMINALILDHTLINGYDELLNRVKTLNIAVYLSFPFVFRSKIVRGNGNDKNADPLYDSLIGFVKNNDYVSGVLVHNLDELGFAADKLPEYRIITDTHLYVHNPAAFSFLHNTGISGITYPYEMNRKDLCELSDNADIFEDIGKYLVVYGYIPMMITAGCIKKTYDACDHKNLSERRVLLKDRKGAEFPVVSDCAVCSNIIYNERPLSLYGMMNDIRCISADSYRINLTVEDYEEAALVIRAFTYGSANYDHEMRNLKTTTGHMKRGAL
ncbi:MAG: U32 family peptidase [Lachnospiraceae bacterium]|nr:U32 family peptidase [Lachnospiraceae bacterium]